MRSVAVRARQATRARACECDEDRRDPGETKPKRGLARENPVIRLFAHAKNSTRVENTLFSVVSPRGDASPIENPSHRATSPRAPQLFHHGRQRQPLCERGRVAQAPPAERHVATHRPGVLHRAHRVRRVLRLRQGDPEESREALGAPSPPARGDAPGAGDARASARRRTRDRNAFGTGLRNRVVRGGSGSIAFTSRSEAKGDTWGPRSAP